MGFRGAAIALKEGGGRGQRPSLGFGCVERGKGW